MEIIPSINTSNKLKWTSLLRQINVCFTVWGLYFVSGFPVGTPTVVFPQLVKEANSTNAVSEQMQSWIGSINCFSGTVFVFVLTIIAHIYGRQKTLLLTSVITFGASTLLFFSRNAVHILISQILYGNLIAASFTVYQLIFTEYSSTHYRGIFLTLKSATFFWGIWTANVIGIFSHYKYIGLLSSVISICCFINSLFIPESPYWLALNKKYDECKMVHRSLKGENENAEKELTDLIQDMQQANKKSKKSNTSIKKYFNHYLNVMKQPEFYKPVALSSLVFLMYHLSGKLACAVYAIELMRKLTGSKSAAHTAVLVLDGFSVLGMYVGCGLSKILRRRTILLGTSAASVAFLLTLALYLYLVKLSYIIENDYIIISLLSSYSLAVCCGPAIMSTSIFGELMPLKARSFSIWFSASLVTIYNGIILKVAPLMFKYFGIHGAFLAYGLSCSVCIILVYRFLPETKDKSIYEIAALFKRKTPKDSLEINLLLH